MKMIFDIRISEEAKKLDNDKSEVGEKKKKKKK